jgi:hypothetical protein
MKKYILGLLCVALASTAWAQSPMPVLPAAQGSIVILGVQEIPSSVHMVQTPIMQVSGGRLLGGSCGAPQCCQPACPTQACCTPTKTICVPEPAVKVTVKISYGSVCEKICYPKCNFGGFLGGSGCNKGCNTGCATACNSTGCNQPECASHVYQKKYLVKRVCVTECPTTKCVPVCVPACSTGYQGVSAGARIVETIPAQPMPSKK